MQSLAWQGGLSTEVLLTNCRTQFPQVVEEKKGDWTFEIEVSVLEIYNEILRDLLGDPKLHKKGLDIRHGKEGPNVPGLSRHPVSNAEEVRDYFKKAQKVRATSSTKMNEVSR